jgi:hypothetical protein
MARQFSVHYASMNFARLIWKQNCLMLIPHADTVGRYCLNKLACHNSSSVYFVIYMTDKQVPVIYPGCFCKKLDA